MLIRSENAFIDYLKELIGNNRIETCILAVKDVIYLYEAQPVSFKEDIKGLKNDVILLYSMFYKTFKADFQTTKTEEQKQIHENRLSKYLLQLIDTFMIYPNFFLFTIDYFEGKVSEPQNWNNELKGYFSDLSYFVYLSQAKLDMLGQQLENKTSDNEIKKLQNLIIKLNEEKLIGELESGKPYLHGTEELYWGAINWGIRDDKIEFCIFFSKELNIPIMMTGSINHLTTHKNYEYFPRGYFGFSGSWLPSISKVLNSLIFEEEFQDDEERHRQYVNNNIGVAAMRFMHGMFCEREFWAGKNFMANKHKLSLPKQKLQFVAKVLKRIKFDKLQRLYMKETLKITYTDFLICTPLYVIQKN